MWGQDSTKRSRKDAELFNNTGFYLNHFNFIGLEQIELKNLEVSP
jgi:hypothetical protein